MSDMYLSVNDFLVQEVIHKSKIKRVIDWKTLDITKEYIKLLSDNKMNKSLDKTKWDWKIGYPKEDDQNSIDRYWVTMLCLPYYPPPDDDDTFLYYNDIGFLSGSAGYIRLRNGYVYETVTSVRS